MRPTAIALPEAPSPKIEYVRVNNLNISIYDRKVWFRLREELYGPPPYDYETIRRIALE